VSPKSHKDGKYRPYMTRRADAICVVSYVYSSHVRQNQVKNLYFPLPLKSLKACKFNKTRILMHKIGQRKWRLWTQRHCLLFLLFSQPRKWQFVKWIQRCQMWEAHGPYHLSLNGRITLVEISNVRHIILTINASLMPVPKCNKNNLVLLGNVTSLEITYHWKFCATV
jgi:hypothetical protein